VKNAYFSAEGETHLSFDDGLACAGGCCAPSSADIECGPPMVCTSGSQCLLPFDEFSREATLSFVQCALQVGMLIR